MQFKYRTRGFNILNLLLTLIILVCLGWFGYAKFAPLFPSIGAKTSVIAPEAPVVMRTEGGLLEVATVRVLERFKRSDTKDVIWIDLGTTVSEIQAEATYRFHIELQKEWPLVVRGKTCIVRAGELKPSLPVALNTASMEKNTTSGWARFNKAENLEALEKSLTPELEARAKSGRYQQLAMDAGRKTVAEFVKTWLVKENRWRLEPGTKIIVLFPGESEPG